MKIDDFIEALREFAGTHGFDIALVADPDNLANVGAFVVGVPELVEQLIVDCPEVDVLSVVSKDSN